MPFFVFLYIFPDALRHLAMAPGYHPTTANLVKILRTSTLFFLFLFFLFLVVSVILISLCVSPVCVLCFLIFIFLFFLVLYFFSFFCVNLTLSLCYVKKEVVRKQRQLLEDVWALFLSWLFRRHSPSGDGFGLPALQTLKQDRHFL